MRGVIRKDNPNQHRSRWIQIQCIDCKTNGTVLGKKRCKECLNEYKANKQRNYRLTWANKKINKIEKLWERVA